MFTVYSENDLGSTLISNLFIDKYMKDANDAQLKIYLYLLRMMNAGKTTSIPDMADQFNHTERDVIRSLHYWERRGLIVLEYNGCGDLMSLRMVSPKADRETPSYSVAFRGGLGAGSVSGASEADTFSGNSASVSGGEETRTAPVVPRLQAMAIPAQHAAAAGTAPLPSAGSKRSEEEERKASFRQPDAASVEAFKSSAKRAQLLYIIEQYIGKPLASSEVESVYYISEQLHFSDALIDYLLQYCIDRGKKDFRYIQKVAVNWAERGITTPKQAEHAVSSFGKGRRNTAGVKPSANPFNQFEQNQYDFDELEKDILSN